MKIVGMKNAHIIWFEIPVSNLLSSIKFYSAFLSINIEVKTLLDAEYGVFKKEDVGIGGVLTTRKYKHPGEGMTIFFYVNDLSEALAKVGQMNGKIALPKTLLRQKTNDGNFSIAHNLFDNNTGYYAEILDPDGNCIGLYSNS